MEEEEFYSVEMAPLQQYQSKRQCLISCSDESYLQSRYHPSFAHIQSTVNGLSGFFEWIYFLSLLTHTRVFTDSLKECDEQLRQILETKQQISVALYEAVTGQESPHRGLLLRGDASDLQQGETLVREAISEGEKKASSEVTFQCIIYLCYFTFSLHLQN